MQTLQMHLSVPKNVAPVEGGNSNPALKSGSQYTTSLEGADHLYSSPVIERGRKAVELLFELKQFIPTFVQNHNIPKSQGEFLSSPRNRVLIPPG